jgi:hypothetical protein
MIFDIFWENLNPKQKLEIVILQELFGIDRDIKRMYQVHKTGESTACVGFMKDMIIKLVEASNNNSFDFIYAELRKIFCAYKLRTT